MFLQVLSASLKSASSGHTLASRARSAGLTEAADLLIQDATGAVDESHMTCFVDPGIAPLRSVLEFRLMLNCGDPRHCSDPRHCDNQTNFQRYIILG